MSDYTEKAKAIVKAWVDKGGKGYPSLEPKLVEAIALALEEAVKAERERLTSGEIISQARWSTHKWKNGFCIECGADEVCLGPTRSRINV
jgi:hypothetical protein